MYWMFLALLSVVHPVAAGRPSFCQSEIDVTREALALSKQTITELRHAVHLIPPPDIVVDNMLDVHMHALNMVDDLLFHGRDSQKIYNAFDIMLLVRLDIYTDLSDRVVINQILAELLIPLDDSLTRVGIALAKCAGKESAELIYRNRFWIAAVVALVWIAWLVS